MTRTLKAATLPVPLLLSGCILLGPALDGTCRLDNPMSKEEKALLHETHSFPFEITYLDNGTVKRISDVATCRVRDVTYDFACKRYLEWEQAVVHHESGYAGAVGLRALGPGKQLLLAVGSCDDLARGGDPSAGYYFSILDADKDELDDGRNTFVSRERAKDLYGIEIVDFRLTPAPDARTPAVRR